MLKNFSVKDTKKCVKHFCVKKCQKIVLQILALKNTETIALKLFTRARGGKRLPRAHFWHPNMASVFYRRLLDRFPEYEAVSKLAFLIIFLDEICNERCLADKMRQLTAWLNHGGSFITTEFRPRFTECNAHLG